MNCLNDRIDMTITVLTGPKDSKSNQNAEKTSCHKQTNREAGLKTAKY